jgi:hypothetical protein
MSEWTYRGANASDAPVFAEWVQNNPQIDLGDVQRTIKGNNPTCIFLVACCDGKPVAFAPLYAQMHLAHLAFSPDARASEKLKAMQGLLDFATAFAVQFGVREITTLSRDSYAMGQVALHLGFEKDDRNLFRFDINKAMEPAAEPVEA